MQLPNGHKWSQTNQGDIFGILHSTEGVTFDSAGKVTFSKKPFVIYGSGQDTDFDYVLSISYFNSNYRVLTDDEIFEGGISDSNYDQISGSPNTANNSDALVVFSRYYVTTNTGMHYDEDDGNWTDTGASLTSGVPHPMESFDSLPTYKLAVGNGNKVFLYDENDNKSSTELVLPEEMQITTMRYRNGYLYVGTKNLNGEDANIYIWNGDGNAAQYEAPVGASWVFSMTQYGNTVAAINSRGQLGQVLGSTFDPIAALPVYYQPDRRWQGSGGLQLNGKVFNRGMCTVGQRIYMMVEGDVDSSEFVPEMKSGLWVFDPEIGLYFRSGIPQTRFEKAQVTAVNGLITVPTAHKLKTGDGIYFNTATGLTGIKQGVVYYVKVESETTLKISRSRKSLLNEKYVNCKGNSVTNNFVYVPNDDVGDSYNGRSGGIIPTVYNETPEDMWESEVIFGSRADGKDSTTSGDYVLCGLTDSWHIGRIETQRIYSANVQEAWKKLHSFVDGLDSEIEEMIVKFRKDKQEETQQLEGMWVSPTKIRSRLNNRETDAWEDVEEGDEIVIVGGQGRGYSVHVTKKEESAETFTLTVDEAIGETDALVEIFATNYKKVGVYNKDNKENGAIKASLDQSGGWGQVKIEYRGFRGAIAINQLFDGQHE